MHEMKLITASSLNTLFKNNFTSWLKRFEELKRDSTFPQAKQEVLILPCPARVESPFAYFFMTSGWSWEMINRFFFLFKDVLFKENLAEASTIAISFNTS